MNLDIRHLRIILALAEERNFTRAASRIGIPQSALSTQMRRIERVLGQALFVRTTRSVVLTERGELLLSSVRAVDSAMRCFEEATQQVPLAVDGPLRIAAQSFSLGEVIDDLQHRFRTPPFRLTITETDGGAPTLCLNEFDVVQAYEVPTSPLEFPTKFRVATVIDEPLWAILPVHHPLAAKPLGE
jgi:DNA-binding transcriptional LysR family regulator